uniref:Uncharacterized protein n=2 Tax=Avena sativa TaxID=4498 RepID=A0ACD5WC00_AVESA
MDSTGIPIVDMSKLRGPWPERPAAIHDLGRACQTTGFFQVVNHGICAEVLHGALDAATAFFNLPTEDKSGLVSDDIRQPVRYSTVSEVDDDGEVKIRRHVLKQYSRPLETWIHKWPSEPIHYREKMATLAAEMWRLVSELAEAVTESLGLGRGYLASRMDRGFEMMALNYYPPCQDVAGAVCCAPHTDYTLLTVLLASQQGLEYFHRESGSWRPAPAGSSTLLVHVGNYLEVLSNGRYRAALHRVVSRPGAAARVSVASLPSFAMDESVEVAEELVEDGHPPLYRGSTLSEFIEFLSAGTRGRDFMEQSLKITGHKMHSDP